jgi:hypothetical protein
MKPCRSYRMTLALLASQVANPAEARRARAHLSACPACRAVYEEYSAVCDRHRAAARDLPSVPVNPQLVCLPDVSQSSACTWNARSRWLDRTLSAAVRWRVWVAAAAAIIIAVGYGSGFRPGIRPEAQVVTRISLALPAPTRVSADTTSRLIDLRDALRQSPEEFEQRLTARRFPASARSQPSFRITAARLEARSWKVEGG